MKRCVRWFKKLSHLHRLDTQIHNQQRKQLIRTNQLLLLCVQLLSYTNLKITRNRSPRLCHRLPKLLKIWPRKLCRLRMLGNDESEMTIILSPLASWKFTKYLSARSLLGFLWHITVVSDEHSYSYLASLDFRYSPINDSGLTTDKQVEDRHYRYSTDIHTTLLFLLRQIVLFFSCFGKWASSMAVLLYYGISFWMILGFAPPLHFSLDSCVET